MIKDDSIGNAYLDKGAALFFLQNLEPDLDIDVEEIPDKETKDIPTSSPKNFSTGNILSLCIITLNNKLLHLNV